MAAYLTILPLGGAADLRPLPKEENTMGRTVLAYSMQLEILEKRLGAFRRGLRREDQELFDDILRAGKNQVQSGVLASCPNPSDPVFFAALIELKRELNEQKRCLDERRQGASDSGGFLQDRPGESRLIQDLKEELKQKLYEELKAEVTAELKTELFEELRLELEEELKAGLSKEIRKAMQEAASGDHGFF